MMDRCNPSARMSAENRRDRHFYIHLGAALLCSSTSPFTDSNMVHQHSAGAPQPNGTGRKTDCWLLAAGWGLGNVAGAVRSGTAHHPRRFVAYTGCGLPMLPDDSPFSWVGVAYPYLTLPWEIGGGLFLFLSVPRIRSRSGSGPLPKTNREKEGKKTQKKPLFIHQQPAGD
ncbi:hypothetical protein CPAR01_02531 [Colletotrichum paranaense]|uniref:Uncharacterized protein n=1 Tax=Colletotrichum paranaense TaxID=1914294 RepID=A0ABQ9SZU4_9PEZI|nr:uncharacterized protein CPAR01_02531 [Colletotrichum paranaense]KAK1545029.1 hypothetical protein CPAR01_02531 [Colletotrichum paranaense]